MELEAAKLKIDDYDKEINDMIEERERILRDMDQHGGHCKHGGHNVPSDQTAVAAETETMLD